MEAAVRIVERRLLGSLRDRRFHSLAEVNAAIGELLRQLNDQRVLRYVSRTRRQLFEEVDAPRLTPLPAEAYVFAQWSLRKVGLDYHVELAGHFYSVPHRHARATVEARLTPRTVEVFLKGERIAAHVRGSGDGKHTTIAEHMPSSHRRYGDWNIERIKREAPAVGPSTALSRQVILEHRPNSASDPAWVLCRWPRPSARAVSKPLANGRYTSTPGATPRSSPILDNRLDGQPVRRPRADPDGDEVPAIAHGNIRGSRYYP